jgi:hypothetical protein
MRTRRWIRAIARALRPLLPGASAVAVAILVAARPPAAAHSAVLVVDSPRVAEGNSGITPLVFHLRLDTTDFATYHIVYRTEDGTAEADSDYAPVSGELVLRGPGAVDSVVVPVFGDTILEANESLRLRIVSADGAVVPDSLAIGTILNDERTHFTFSTNSEFTLYPWTVAPAFADVDGDGDLDLPLYQCFTYESYREEDGFRAVLEGGNYHGSAWCDYDKDGDPDLVILPYELQVGDTTRGKFFRNDHGQLTDIAPSLGMDFFGNGETAVWGDFDGDEWPDLFTPYYAWRTPYRSFLYMNQHDGTFFERATDAGVDLHDQPPEFDAEGAQAADWNDDGYLDLYAGGHLFQNDGTGHFTDVRESTGLPWLFDEGAEFVDYDNDGDLDLYLRTQTGPQLFRNDGGQFHELTTEVGLPATGLAWGDRWIDADGDGDLDLLVASLSGLMRLFLNRGDGTFEEDSTFLALGVRGSLTAIADVDGDGDLDFVTVPGTPELLINHANELAGQSRSYLKVRVFDRTGHETAFGATVKVRFPNAPERGVMTRIVDGGSAYLTQSEYTLTFGGVGKGPVSLEVDYPSPTTGRNIVSGATNPVLAAFDPAESPSRTVDVYQDGRVEFEPAPVTGVSDLGFGRPAGAAAFASVAPSPASAAAAFTIAARDAGNAALTLFDVRGRRVRDFAARGVAAGGELRFTWDLTDEGTRRVAAGVYFARLSWNGKPIDAHRIVVTR